MKAVSTPDCTEHRRGTPPKEPGIRDGVREDAAHLTHVVDLASEGLALAMWTDLAGDDGNPWQIGRERAMRTEVVPVLDAERNLG